MPRQPNEPRINTGLEMHDDTDLPIEDIENVAEEILSDEETAFNTASESEETELETSADDEESKTREKWKNRILFQNYEDALASPPTKEDNSPAVDDEGKPVFKIFVVKYRAYENRLDQDPDNLRLVYVWARNTQESIVVVAQFSFDFTSQQYGAKRGRRKLFKPDDNIVKLANMVYLPQKNTPAGKVAIAGFLECMPDYAYLFSGENPPEFATVKKVLAVKS